MVTYVSGACRHVQLPPLQDGTVQPLRIRRTPPLFEPKLWNVHDATIDGAARTNNMCEAWNRAYSEMLGHSHPTTWKAIEALRKDNAMVETLLYKNTLGEPPIKRVKKVTKKHQESLQKLCVEFSSNERNIEEFLRAVGHRIRIV